MNDVRPVLRDDVLLDRLALGERPDDAGAVEDLLLALRADSLAAVPPVPAASVPAASVPAPRGPRVVRLRSTLAGALVAAAVLAGTSGVAAAVTGDPLAGLSGVRDAVLVVAQPQGRTPLLRSVEGARVHVEVQRVADLLAAGRVDDARVALAAMPALLQGLSPDEQDLLLAELTSTAPHLVGSAGLVEADGLPVPGDGATSPTAPGSDAAEHDKPVKTPKPSKPPTPEPSVTVPAVIPPVTVPPTTTPPSPSPTTPTTPPSTPPSTPPTTPPSSSTAPTTPPTTSALGSPAPSAAPGNGRGAGSPTDPGRPTKPPKPPRNQVVEPSATAS